MTAQSASSDASASQVLVPVARLLARPGSQETVVVLLAFEGELAAKVDASVARQLSGEVVVDSTADGLAVRGELEMTWSGECRRCLGPVTDPMQLSVSEMYQREPVEGETYPIDADDLDLAPMLREVGILALPLAPLCQSDCAGPAPELFPTGPPEESERPPGDPRWAALDALTFDNDVE